MSDVVVSSKYQIVIPAAVRKSLGIKKGQRLHLIIKNGSIKLVPSVRLAEMRGCLRGMSTDVARDEEERF
ncbi:MAG: AbrB/MazE/SpoVT family DNA-binding domain-containing protein [Bacillota bacterium]